MPYGSVQTKMTLAEMPVELKQKRSCGTQWWWGEIGGTDGKPVTCCKDWTHTTREEALLCTRLHVAQVQLQAVQAQLDHALAAQDNAERRAPAPDLVRV